MNENTKDARYQDREHDFIDIDRMINEGLGGGNVTMHNGLIEQSTVDTKDNKESILSEEDT